MINYNNIEVTVHKGSPVKFTDYHVECAIYWLYGESGDISIDDGKFELIMLMKVRWDVYSMLCNRSLQ